MSSFTSEASRDGAFASTRWSLIRDAAETKAGTNHSLGALSELCRIYWRPVYLFLRRQGASAHDAQDLTQSFFAEMIESRSYARADREKGRFRSFLLGTLKHFVADAHERERAQKRGGGLAPVALDADGIARAEAEAARSERWAPDLAYEREWVAVLLGQVMQRLETEAQLAGKGALFQELRAHLSVRGEAVVPYDEMSVRLARPAATLRSDVARLRARYRAILREEVRDTVSTADEVEDELKYLRQVLAA